MRARMASLMAVAATLSLVAAACGGGGGGGGGSPSASASGGAEGTMKIGSDTANNHGSKDVFGESSVEVEQDDYYFGPTVLTGSPGQKLTIKLHNEGSVTHNFSLDAQNIDQDVSNGQEGTVTVAFPQSGILEFYCKFHRSSGMVGELSVA